MPILGKRSYRKYNNGAQYNNRPFKKPRYSRKRTTATRRLLNYRTGGYSNIETKFVDYNVALSGVSNIISGAKHDPAVNCLNAIAQGDGESDRDGRKATIKSLHIKGTVTAAEADKFGTKVRVIIVKDTQTNGVQLSPIDVLQVPPGQINQIDAFRNLQYTSRFKVYYDKTFVLNPVPYWNTLGAVAVGNEPRRDFTVNLTNLNCNVIFDGTTADVSTITDNSFHLLAYTDQGAAVTYNSRCRFVG